MTYFFAAGNYILAIYFITYGVLSKLKTDPQLIRQPQLEELWENNIYVCRCLLTFGKHNFTCRTELINILYEFGTQGQLFIIVNNVAHIIKMWYTNEGWSK
jgi:hypothetical protein